MKKKATRFNIYILSTVLSVAVMMSGCITILRETEAFGDKETTPPATTLIAGGTGDLLVGLAISSGGEGLLIGMLIGTFDLLAGQALAKKVVQDTKNAPKSQGEPGDND